MASGHPRMKIWGCIQTSWGMNIPNWLVLEPYPSEKYELVSWDDEIPNIGKIKFKFQTTNQININFGESRRIPGFCLPIFQLTQKLVVSVWTFPYLLMKSWSFLLHNFASCGIPSFWYFNPGICWLAPNLCCLTHLIGCFDSRLLHIYLGL